MFYHSLVSDWNHGNAHFLRGICTELIERGHSVRVFEPEDGWSRANLLRDHGHAAIAGFQYAYSRLTSELYRLDSLDLDNALYGADLVLVHEWNHHDLVARIGEHHRRHPSYLLFFHDTHHRAVTDPRSMVAYDLHHYDGVLAFGDVLRDLYLTRAWARNAWTWHEAADTRVFRPLRRSGSGASTASDGDLVWIGNWGDEERTAELQEFLLTPVRALGLRAHVYGVRFPQEAIRQMADHGVEYRGWLPNYDVPAVFSTHAVTIHVPRRPYVEVLHGVPTIRPFEALACGIPLISARWHRSEGLLTAGRDYVVARNGTEMTSLLRRLLSNSRRAQALADNGLRTVLSRHTCAHRVDELLEICRDATSQSSGRAIAQVASR
jgi:spore maturation protein CgeB